MTLFDLEGLHSITLTRDTWEELVAIEDGTTNTETVNGFAVFLSSEDGKRNGRGRGRTEREALELAAGRYLGEVSPLVGLQWEDVLQ